MFSMSWRSHWIRVLVTAIFVTAVAFNPAYAGIENRPLDSDEAETLPPGTVSVSFGPVHAKEDDGDVEINLSLDLTYGITKNFEVGIDIPSLFLSPQEGNDTEGFGDVSLRPEWVFYQESRMLPSLSMAGTVKFPTGSERKGLGSGLTDYTVELLASKSFGPTMGEKSMLLSVNLTHTFVGGADDIFSPSANMAYFVNDNLTVVGELLGEILTKKNSLRSLVGVIYGTSSSIAIDAGVGFGLINADLDWSVTVGITYDFRSVFSLP